MRANGTFSPDQLHRMFEAYDRAKVASQAHPNVLATRIINAAQRGIDDVDELVAVALAQTHPIPAPRTQRPSQDGA